MRARTLYDLMIRGANFKVGYKVWLMDQGTKVGVNLKLRPRWKRPYLVTDMFNEVNAVLKADGRSKNQDCKSLKVEKVFGKPPMLSRLTADSINESSLISNSFDPMSLAPNQKRERVRMACANEYNYEISTHQPLGQVARVERDEQLLTVNSQHSDNTVVKLLIKGRSNNKEDVHPGSSRASSRTAQIT